MKSVTHRATYRLTIAITTLIFPQSCVHTKTNPVQQGGFEFVKVRGRRN